MIDYYIYIYIYIDIDIYIYIYIMEAIIKETYEENSGTAYET